MKGRGTLSVLLGVATRHYPHQTSPPVVTPAVSPAESRVDIYRFRE